jgi:hypothetical protein
MEVNEMLEKKKFVVREAIGSKDAVVVVVPDDAPLEEGWFTDRLDCKANWHRDRMADGSKIKTWFVYPNTLYDDNEAVMEYLRSELEKEFDQKGDGAENALPYNIYHRLAHILDFEVPDQDNWWGAYCNCLVKALKEKCDPITICNMNMHRYGDAEWVTVIRTGAKVGSGTSFMSSDMALVQAAIDLLEKGAFVHLMTV